MNTLLLDWILEINHQKSPVNLKVIDQTKYT